jgi:sugar lactone lactonase YvrE
MQCQVPRRAMLTGMAAVAAGALLAACGQEPDYRRATETPTPAPTRILPTATPTLVPTGVVSTPTSVAAAAASVTPVVEYLWRAERGLTNPGSVAVDGKGNLYVTVKAYPHIVKLDSTGRPIASWGNGPGGSDGQFVIAGGGRIAYGIALDLQGNVYATDFNGRVQKFGPNGTFLMQFGAPGAGDGQFTYPLAVAVDGDGNVYVTDMSDRVQKFDKTGAFLAAWGSHGTDKGQLNGATGITVVTGGPSGVGAIFVTDTGNNRIVQFDLSGMFRGQWGSFGVGDGEFDGPQFPALDANRNLYIADSNNHRVQELNMRTNPGDFLARWGRHGSGEGQFDIAGGVAVDNRGNIFVTDVLNNRIQKFKPVVPAIPRST